MTRHYAVYIAGAVINVVNRVKDARTMAKSNPSGDWKEVGWLEARNLRKQIAEVRKYSAQDNSGLMRKVS